MRAEGQGKHDEARTLFTEALEAAQDDYEACVAAHFLARQQDTPQEMLRWNQEALDRANAVGDERVQVFYPSLYLNMGYAYEQLGQADEAKHYYDLAAACTADLPEDRYGAVVRGGIQAGQARIQTLKD
jgi:tetratricopeptide (TPR) repeat protein